jgi:hypothetical protein
VCVRARARMLTLVHCFKLGLHMHVKGKNAFSLEYIRLNDKNQFYLMDSAE